MDAGNMLKPMLARGELHCIGATTLAEYRRHIEKDAAFERRFQPVMVDEPSVEDAISILRGLRERFEVHHGVKIQDAALVAAATLSHRYIADRFLPDKAIDLVDEACAVIRTEIDSMPQELDQVTRRMTRLEVEEAALRKESDPASRERLEALRRELADLRARARRDARPVGGRALGHQEGPEPARAARAAPARDRGRRARLRARPGGRAALREAPRAGGAAAQRGGDARAPPGWAAAAAGGGDRGRDRGGRRPLDRHPGRAPARGRAREAAAAGGRPARAGDRPGRGGAARIRRRHPGAGGDQGPAPADRVLHLPGPDGRREDRAVARARRGALRLRGQHRPRRHVRVPGAAHREPAGGRPARLRRLRGGRPAHRGRPAHALLGGAARRDREGALGRLQRAPADPRRRAPDRLAGPHRGLQEHGRDHDQQHRLPPPAGRDRCARRDPGGRAGRRDGRAARPLPAGVPQPRRRHRAVQAADARRRSSGSWSSRWPTCAGAWPTGASRWS